MLLIPHKRTLIFFLFTASVVHQPSREVMSLSDPILSEEKDWRENTDVSFAPPRGTENLHKYSSVCS